MGYSSGHRSKFTALLAFVISFLMTIQALAQSTDFNRFNENRNEKRFLLSTNWIYAKLETNIRFESLTGFLGLKIELEEDLGLDKWKSMPVFTAMIKLGDRHYINAWYYYLARGGTRITEKEFEFNGVLFGVGTEINTYFDLHALSIGYAYQLIRQERAGVAIFANLYTTFVSSGMNSNLEKLNENARFPAVFPNLGLIPYYKLTDRIGFSGIISLFFMNMDEYSGSVHNIGAQLDLLVTPWLGLGIGYYLFDVTMEMTESTFTGIFDYTYQGPYIGLGFRF
jgi:putative salt-induced outer membrane protein YdiY